MPGTSSAPNKYPFSASLGPRALNAMPTNLLKLIAVPSSFQSEVLAVVKSNLISEGAHTQYSWMVGIKCASPHLLPCARMNLLLKACHPWALSTSPGLSPLTMASFATLYSAMHTVGRDQ